MPSTRTGLGPAQRHRRSGQPSEVRSQRSEVRNRNARTQLSVISSRKRLLPHAIIEKLTGSVTCDFLSAHGRLRAAIVAVWCARNSLAAHSSSLLPCAAFQLFSVSVFQRFIRALLRAADRWCRSRSYRIVHGAISCVGVSDQTTASVSAKSF
jgi:hypothetical protein